MAPYSALLPEAERASSSPACPSRRTRQAAWLALPLAVLGVTALAWGGAAPQALRVRPQRTQPGQAAVLGAPAWSLGVEPPLPPTPAIRRPAGIPWDAAFAAVQENHWWPQTTALIGAATMGLTFLLTWAQGRRPGPPRWALLPYTGGGDDDGGGDRRDVAGLSPAELLGLVGASAALTALLGVALLFREDLEAGQRAFSEAFGFSVGDVVGAALWSLALWFTTPYQVVKLFFGSFDGERPSTWIMNQISRAEGLDPAAPDHRPSLPARLATLGVVVAAGAAVAVALERTLGGATWAVSSGLGLCFSAAIFEAGRPTQLSQEEAQTREEHWQVFSPWADQFLQRRGQCHYIDVDQAFRRYPPHGRYRTTAGLSDQELQELIRAWAPKSRRTSNGFYKGLSLIPVNDRRPLAIAPEEPPERVTLLDEILKQ